MRKFTPANTDKPQIQNFGYYDKSLPIHDPCAIYARQSTTKQVLENRESSEMQTTELVTRVLREGWKEGSFVVYIEGDGKRGVSGTKRIDQRPGLRALMERVYNDEVKAIFVYDVSRLFRDEFQIQVNTYIQACYDHDVLTITPMYRYDFRRHPYDMEQFKREAEQAANFIKNHLKKFVLPAKDRVTLDGRYNGSFIPVGYIVDRSDKHNKRYIVYEPHAKIVRYIFKRFRELSGRLYQLGKELDNLPYVFPAFDSSVPFHKTKLKPKNGGYALGRSGLEGLLTNLKYLGWWTVGEMDEDGHRSGNALQVISKNNHEPIVDPEDFWYAFRMLSDTDIDGTPIERDKQPIRYTQNGKPETPALLKDVIESAHGRPAYVNVKGRGDVEYIAMSSGGSDFGGRVATTIGMEALDNVFVGRMLYWLNTFKRIQDRCNRATNMITRKESICNSVRNGMYTQLIAIQTEQDVSMGSIDTQITETEAAIARAERDKQIASEIGYTQGIKDAMIALRDLHTMLEDLRRKQSQAVNAEQEEEECLDKIDEVLSSWDRMPFERKKRFVHLAIDKVIISVASPRWLSIQIVWKGPLTHTDVGWIRRVGSTNADWTNREQEIVRDLYPYADANEIMEYLPNRSWHSIVADAKRLRVHRHRRQAIVDERLLNHSLEDVAFMEENGIPVGERVYWLSGARINKEGLSPSTPLDLPPSLSDSQPTSMMRNAKLLLHGQRS